MEKSWPEDPGHPLPRANLGEPIFPTIAYRRPFTWETANLTGIRDKCSLYKQGLSFNKDTLGLPDFTPIGYSSQWTE